MGVLAVIVIGSLLIFFTSLAYFVLASLVSFKLGALVFTMIQKKLELDANYKYGVIAIVFIIFVVFYFILKDLFVVIITSLFGTVFSIISLDYFGITELNIIFEIEISDFEDLTNMDAQHASFYLMFFCLFCIGLFT